MEMHADDRASVAIQPSVAESVVERKDFMRFSPCMPVGMEFKDLIVDVEVPIPSKNLWDKMVNKKTMTKRLIHGISGRVSPGQLLAVMGASGAGKSTLLNALASRKQPSAGSITWNGRPLDKEFSRRSAFVQQDDLFLPHVTVEEHLRFQADMRLPASLTPEHRQRIVDRLIVRLGLSKCRSNRIGNIAMGGGRGISGGERKRLSIASELITDPSVLFLDEPTTGLDSYMAVSVVKLLKTLASSDRTIVCTIHQPSSDVFAMFDWLLLLSEGSIAYYGPTADATAYFSRLNWMCPSDNNPADYLIRTLALPWGDTDRAQKVRAITDAWVKGDVRRDMCLPEPAEFDHETAVAQALTARTSMLKQKTGGVKAKSARSLAATPLHDNTTRALFGRTKDGEAATAQAFATAAYAGAGRDGSSGSSEEEEEEAANVVITEEGVQVPTPDRGTFSAGDDYVPSITSAAAQPKISPVSPSVLATSPDAPAAQDLTSAAIMQGVHFSPSSNQPTPNRELDMALNTAAGVMDASPLERGQQPALVEGGRVQLTPMAPPPPVPIAAASRDITMVDSSLFDTSLDPPVPFTAEGYATSYWRQFFVLLKRAAMNDFRNPLLMSVRVLQSIIIGGIFGCLFLRLPNTQRAVQNKAGAIFFIIMNQSLVALYGVLQTFPLERPVAQREYESGAYRIVAYYSSKIWSDFPYQVVMPVVFTAITYFTVGFNDDFTAFTLFTFVVIIATQAAVGLGYLLSATAPNVNVAVSMGNASLMPLAMVSGFLINFSDIAPMWRWLEYVSFFRFSFAGGLQAIFGTNYPPFEDCPKGGYEKYGCIHEGEDVLKYYSVPESDGSYLWVCVGALLGMTVVFRAAGALLLHRHANEKKAKGK